VSRAAARALLVPDAGPPFCPRCGKHLSFECDRQGRTLEHCHCGYRGAVRLRDGKPVVQPPPLPLQPPPLVT